MGGRAAYTLATGLFIGIGSLCGIIPVIVKVLPVAAVCPILVFVGLEIITQSYHESPRRHAPAVSMAFLPAVASLVLIYFDQFAAEFAGAVQSAAASMPDIGTVVAFPPRIAALHATVRILGHGFILTAMMWGGVMAASSTGKPGGPGCSSSCAPFSRSSGSSTPSRPTATSTCRGWQGPGFPARSRPSTSSSA